MSTPDVFEELHPLKAHIIICCSHDLAKGHNPSVVQGGIPKPWFLYPKAPPIYQRQLRSWGSGNRAGERGFALSTSLGDSPHPWSCNEHHCSEGTWAAWDEICVGTDPEINQSSVAASNKADLALEPSLFLVARWIMNKYKSQRIYLMMARRGKGWIIYLMDIIHPSIEPAK